MEERSSEGMDCPDCGVYNPAGRVVCWRCNRELPRPKEKKKGKSFWRTQNWLYIVMAILMLLSLLQLCNPMSLPGADESGALPMVPYLARHLPSLII